MAAQSIIQKRLDARQFAASMRDLSILAAPARLPDPDARDINTIADGLMTAGDRIEVLCALLSDDLTILDAWADAGDQVGLSTDQIGLLAGRARNPGRRPGPGSSVTVVAGG